MSTIKLPLDTKSLYFNIRNDNFFGHTPTVATPIKKRTEEARMEDIRLLKNNEIRIPNDSDLYSLLISGSKTRVLIKNIYVFDKLSVNGKPLDANCSFGVFIKEEIDPTKVRYGREKVHYPSKFIFNDGLINVNNKKVYEAMSIALNGYAFIVRSLNYYQESGVLNFDALIVGENQIPYSKVFIKEKGAGNKFVKDFQERFDDYDREIIFLRKKYGEAVVPSNYEDYFSKISEDALKLLSVWLGHGFENVSKDYPYSLFDVCYEDKNGEKKYGIIRLTAGNKKYFNLSIAQKSFLANNKNNAFVFMITDALRDPTFTIYSNEDVELLSMTINSLKFEED